jgi:hypothetical protein
VFIYGHMYTSMTEMKLLKHISNVLFKEIMVHQNISFNFKEIMVHQNISFNFKEIMVHQNISFNE